MTKSKKNGKNMLQQKRALTAEQALWCAVLEQAFNDARRYPGLQKRVDRLPRGSALDSLLSELNECRHSRAWLLARNEDFMDVCLLAGCDPEAVSDEIDQQFGGSY